MKPQCVKALRGFMESTDDNMLTKGAIATVADALDDTRSVAIVSELNKAIQKVFPGKAPIRRVSMIDKYKLYLDEIPR
jgi:hypothetical protein